MRQFGTPKTRAEARDFYVVVACQPEIVDLRFCVSTFFNPTLFLTRNGEIHFRACRRVFQSTVDSKVAWL